MLSEHIPALTITSRPTTSTRTPLPLALTTHHTPRRRMATLLLNMRLRHNLRRQVQPLPQIIQTLGSQGVVVPLPAELRLEVAARGQGLAGLDDVEVLGLDLVVLGQVEVLLRDADTFAEEVFVDLLAVGFGDQPGSHVLALRFGFESDGKEQCVHRGGVVCCR